MSNTWKHPMHTAPGEATGASKAKAKPEREPVAHYATPGGIECIDFLRSLGIAYEFSRGNAIKYLTRAGRKDGNTAIGDLEKARTYINFMLEELQGDV